MGNVLPMGLFRRDSTLNRETLHTWTQVLLIFAVLYVFLASIGAMGAAFKLYGKAFATQLVDATSHPVLGLFVGILATTLVQSSSTTTSLVVGIVAGGGLDLITAIPIVMGANIGTSVTNTLVSMGHITRPTEFRRAIAGATVHDFFNVIAVAIMLPLELSFGLLQRLAAEGAVLFQNVGGMKLANPLKAAVTPLVKALSDATGHQPTILLIVSLVLMFLALRQLVKLARGVGVSRAERFLDTYLFGAAWKSFVFGIVLTVLVQSSSISTSVAIPLIGAGLLTVAQIFPYTLGANIGTTVTALLAAMSTANIAAVTIAFVHLLFNISGILLIYPVEAVRRIPLRLADALASLASRRRWIAMTYIIILFYAVPALVITLWR